MSSAPTTTTRSRIHLTALLGIISRRSSWLPRPGWIDRSEYDVEARMPAGADRQKIALMLRSLLADRFHLKEHSETREMRVYEMTVGKGGPKIQPVKPGALEDPAQSGFHFRGDMREFADLLAVQFSIPAPSDPS